MVNYAFIDSNNFVKNVLFFETEPEDLSPFIESQNLLFEGSIVQAIKIEETDKFAGVESKYENGKFILPKPYNSWIWDDLAECWISPVPHPMEINGADRSPYLWNEESQSWEPM